MESLDMEVSSYCLALRVQLQAGDWKRVVVMRLLFAFAANADQANASNENRQCNQSISPRRENT
jgi:hypothetical protein